MKTIMTVVLALALSKCVLANDSASPFSLEIALDKGVVTGYVRNTSTNVVKVNSRHLYGHWEFTSVFYLYGRWQEAPYVEKQRGRIGTVSPPAEIELKPGEVLASTDTEFNRIAVSSKPLGDEFTFKIDLSEHVLPPNFWDVSELRVVTCGLWSNIIKIGNPNQSLKATAKPSDDDAVMTTSDDPAAYQGVLVGSLHGFAESGDLAAVKAILELHPEFVNARRIFQQPHKPMRTDNFTLLHRAAEQGREQVVAFLLEKGADVNAADRMGWTPLHLAAQKGTLPIVKLLVAHGARVDAATTAVAASFEVPPCSADGAPPCDLPAVPSLTPLDLARAGKHAELVAYLTAVTKPDRDAATLMPRIRAAIEAGPTFEKLSEILGEPDMDIGSGIHIFVYRLSDGTGITVGTPDKKMVMYIDHAGKRLFPIEAKQAAGTVIRRGDNIGEHLEEASPLRKYGDGKSLLDTPAGVPVVSEVAMWKVGDGILIIEHSFSAGIIMDISYVIMNGKDKERTTIQVKEFNPTTGDMTIVVPFHENNR